VTIVEPDAIRLDDGTATARIVLEGQAVELAALLQLGDAVNVTGTPEIRDEVVLVVGDPDGVILLGDLGGDAGDSPEGHLLAMAESGGDGGSVDAASATSVSAALVGLRAPGPLTAGLALLVLLGTIAAAIAARRALTVRRRARARIQARLDAIVATPPPSPGPHPAP
jgi:hypothetical protein